MHYFLSIRSRSHIAIKSCQKYKDVQLIASVLVHANIPPPSNRIANRCNPAIRVGRAADSRKTLAINLMQFAWNL